jgi:general secretion pathway protein K
VTARRRASFPARRGVALIAVLWIVAALTVLVTGVVQAQRSELRLAGAERASLVGEAAGQAAIHVVLQRLVGGAPRVDRLTRTAVRYDERDVVVEVMPLTGLVDLNRAPVPLLTAWLIHAGGLDEPRAREVADALVARRTAGSDALLDAPEELLTLPGVDVDLFARLAPFVTTDSRGGGRLNPLAAPFDVLLFLAGGNAAVAQRIADDRDAGVPAIDTTRLEGAFIDATVSSRYRFTARVPMPDGAVVLVVRDVDVTAPPSSRAPWQTLRASARRLAAGRDGG